ncbi:MAG: hypothetical protein WDW38_010871 [Sanguina aurantia]
MYNDEDPYSRSEHQSSAHAKGVLAFSATPSASGPLDPSSVTGFWITHSIPKFPSANFTLPDWHRIQPSQTVYGQHALCLSLAPDGIDSVAASLLTSHAFVYNHSSAGFGPILRYLLPNVKRLLDGRFPRTHSVYDSPLAVTLTLTGSGSSSSSTAPPSPWRLMSKPPALSLPFHEAVLEARLGVGMEWQTWQRGAGGRLPSTCPPQGLYPYNSLNIRVLGLQAAGIVWPSTSDHSKWGVSLPPGSGANSACGLHASLNNSSSSSKLDSIIRSSRKVHSLSGDSLQPGDTSDVSGRDGSSTAGALKGDAGLGGGSVFCFGDLNREFSQRSRGGGAVCGHVPGLWQEMVQLVRVVEGCRED